MTKETLSYLLTGVENPNFCTERETTIIEQCAKIITDIEQTHKTQNETPHSPGLWVTVPLSTAKGKTKGAYNINEIMAAREVEKEPTTEYLAPDKYRPSQIAHILNKNGKQAIL